MHLIYDSILASNMADKKFGVSIIHVVFFCLAFTLYPWPKISEQCIKVYLKNIIKK